MPPLPTTGFARDALNAAAQLHLRATDLGAGAALEWELVQATRALLGGRVAVLLGTGRAGGRLHAVASDPFLTVTEGARLERGLLDPAGQLALGRAAAVPDAGRAALGDALGLRRVAESVVLLPLGADGQAMLAVVDPPGRFDVEAATAFAVAAGTALASRALAREQQFRAAEQRALARASEVLHASLDLHEVLQAIAAEARTILDADHGVAFLGTLEEGLVVEAAVGLPAGTVGRRLAADAGLAGQVLTTGRPAFTNDHAAHVEDPRSPFARTRSAVAVPIGWGGQLRGVLSVGHDGEDAHVGERQLSLLQAFAALAAAACRNASEATDLAHAARTDSLTGLLNHAAYHEAVERAVQEATDRPRLRLAAVLIDLDDFKAVNESGGHLVGDAFLRDVAAALRLSFGGAEVVARYGGDEFAALIPGADEGSAAARAAEAVERVRAVAVAHGLPASTGATAGVATFLTGDTATSLIDRADRALLHGKQVIGRGVVVRASLEAARATTVAPTGRPTRARVAGVDLGTNERDRLRKRTRQLAMASALGTRLAAMTDPAAIVEAAVDELHRAFGSFLCAAVRIDDDRLRVRAAAVRGAAFERLGAAGWTQPTDHGLIGRVLRDRHAVVVADVRSEPEFAATTHTTDVRSECLAPVWVGEELWGVLNLEEVRVGAFDADDVRLLQTVADQLGSALRTAQLFAQLEDAYLGTAEALATALEAKDAYTAAHARSIVERAEAVGRRLGMGDLELRDLRYGAAFHDIGKIAVPEAILDKQGPLTPEERAVVERHTIVGEQILRPVAFLSGVLPIVRHEHERYDGRGYPDGLAGEDIPLGARIVLVCDAFDAMTTDRPYRRALDEATAVAELVEGAGTQFDPRVVEAFLEVGGVARPVAGTPARRRLPSGPRPWRSERRVPIVAA